MLRIDRLANWRVLSSRVDLHYECRKMRVFPPAGRIETSRGEVCQGSGTLPHYQCSDRLLADSRCLRLRLILSSGEETLVPKR